MRKTAIAAVVIAFAALWMDVAAAAEPDVNKVWNTSAEAYARADPTDASWNPLMYVLDGYAVFDESNRYQYTQVTMYEQGFGAANGMGPGFHYFERSLFCKFYDRTVLQVSEAGADLVATMDPASPDCLAYGMAIDCDEAGNCNFNENYVYTEPRVVQGHWAQPQLTWSATSTVHEAGYLPVRRNNSVCKSSEGRMLSGTFTLGGSWYDVQQESFIKRSQCQATQQQNP
jgi:hypothetical protein